MREPIKYVYVRNEKNFPVLTLAVYEHPDHPKTPIVGYALQKPGDQFDRSTARLVAGGRVTTFETGRKTPRKCSFIMATPPRREHWMSDILSALLEHHTLGNPNTFLPKRLVPVLVAQQLAYHVKELEKNKLPRLERVARIAEKHTAEVIAVQDAETAVTHTA